MVLQIAQCRVLNGMAQKSVKCGLNCQLERNLLGRVTTDRVTELQNGIEMLSENN